MLDVNLALQFGIELTRALMAMREDMPPEERRKFWERHGRFLDAMDELARTLKLPWALPAEPPT